MLEVFIRPEAEADLETITDYTIARWGIDRAQSYIAALRADIESLSEFAQRYPLHHASQLGLRHMGSGHHLVFYLVNKIDVEVVRILHERMDAGSNIP